MDKRNLVFICAMSLWVSAAGAIPPPVPSAGVVEREIEKEYEAKPLEPEREVPAIRIDIPQERLKMSTGKKVFIHQVEIRGNESILSEEICSWLEGCLDCELYLRDIYEICEKIEEGYAKRGYFLARAYPPPQDIRGDTLIIEVLEGKLGNVTVVGEPKYYTKEFIQGYFNRLQNRPLQYNQFLRALMLLNENSGMMAGAVFEKGKETGYADVIVRFKEEYPRHLYLNGNNYGRDLTTNVRAGGRLDWGNLFKPGDKFSLAEVVGFPVNALYFTNVIYKIPVNRNGTFLEGAYLFSRFKIEELTRLHMKGRSDMATLKLSQSLTRTKTLSLDVFSYFDYKQIQNFVLGHRTSFDKLRVLTVGALLDHFTPSQGRDYIMLQLAGGIPSFIGGLKPVDKDCSRKGGGGRYFMLNLDYDRLQKLPKNCYFYFHGSGQISPNKLTLPEQIYIGGVDTVRGFPLAVGLGDSGYYLNFEFRLPPPFVGEKRFWWSKRKWKNVLQLDAFLDHGGVFLKSEQNTFLWGSGLGLKIYGSYDLAFSIDVGFPLNHRKLTNGAFLYIKLTGKAF